MNKILRAFRGWVANNARAGIGILVSAACLVLAFWKVNWRELWDTLLVADRPLLLLACFSYTASILCRSASWRKILSRIKMIPLQAMFAYECIGYLANNIVPLRLGELVRAVLVAEREMLAKTAVLSTIALERLFDILLLFLTGLMVLAFMALPADAVYSIWIVGGSAIAVLLLLWFLSGHAGIVRGLWRKGKNSVSTKWQAQVEAFVSALHNIMLILQDRAGLALALFWLAVSWALAGLMTYLLMRAAHLSLPWSAAMVQLVIVNLGAMIPSSPGGLGVVHYLTILTLSLWGINSSQAMAFALLFHGIPYLLTMGLGASFLAREGVRITNLGRIARSSAMRGERNERAEQRG